MGKIAIPQFVGDAGEADTSSQSRAKKNPLERTFPYAARGVFCGCA
jgi:hypothetical protein